MTYWLDYSAAKLSGPTIKAAGYGGAIRYIDAPNRLGNKHTNKPEYQSIMSAGLGIRLVIEVGTGDADGGYPQGVAYAQRAKAGADYLGYSGVIYFCNDRPSLASAQVWDDYLTGAASVLGWARVGAYGFANAIDVASHMTGCTNFWQAGRRSDVRDQVQVWQDNNTQVIVGGIVCDRNLILHPLEDGVSDMQWTDRVTVVSPLNPDYKEDHTVGEVLSAAYYNSADARKAAEAALAKVEAGGVSVDEVAAKVVALIKSELANSLKP